VVHFGGYQVGETSTLTLRVTNVGPVAKRMHIIPPTTPFYKLRYAKLGVVAPGMSQIIKVRGKRRRRRQRAHKAKPNRMGVGT
jgi:hypothetical protein